MDLIVLRWYHFSVFWDDDTRRACAGLSFIDDGFRGD